MNGPALWTLLCGLAAGLAAVCLLVACLRPAPLDLVAALARLDDTSPRPDPATAGNGGSVRWLGPVVARCSKSGSRWWGVPTAELDLLERAPAWYVGSRIAWSVACLGLTALCWLLAMVAGVDIPVEAVLAGGAVGAASGAMVPVFAVREDAANAREEFRRTVAAYLTLVAQERATGRAPSQALGDAATVGDNWVFRRIRAALTSARRAGITPWEAMTRLAEQVGVAALADLADILATAADGAAVYTTLTAKAKALRVTAVTDERGRANKRSEQLTIPGTLLLIGWLIVLLYPTAIRLVQP